MSISQDVIVLNDFGGGRLERRRRTSSKGTSDRFSVSIRSQPILHNFDPLKLGQGPAVAIRDLIQRQIRNVTARAAESTILKRKYAATALAAGKSWARARWSGGRIGPREPNRTDKLFRDSGRLAELEVRENKAEGSWTVNVAANRLDPKTFRDGEVGLSRMVRRLVDVVPALQGRGLLEDQTVVQAIAQASEDAIAVLDERGRAAYRGRRAEWLALAGDVYKELLEPLLLA